jgi:predicted nucleic acid-binding protein
VRRVYFDENIVLDFLLKRTPWRLEAEQLFSLGVTGKVDLFCYVNAPVQAYHFMRKVQEPVTAKGMLTRFMRLITLVPLRPEQLTKALERTDTEDLEDNLHVELVMSRQCEVLITRDTGLRTDAIPIQSPGVFLRSFPV